MTDAEIAKAKAHFEYGIKCDIFSEPVLSYAETALEAFDLINRQKVEIESLQKQARLDEEYIKNLEKAFNDRTAELQTAKFEVKQLNIDVKRIENQRITDCRYWQKKYFALRTEIIKEFAERLKEEACGNDLYDRSGYSVKAVTIEDTNNVKREMEGEK